MSPPRTAPPLLLVALALVAAASAIGSATATDRYDLNLSQARDLDDTVVETAFGRVDGSREGEYYAFRGIPYADDTSGANRWMPPRDPKPWKGSLFDASEYGPVCPQPAGRYFSEIADVLGVATDHPTTFNHLPPTAPALVSEDCLRINVFSPSLNESAGAPVMFWIHGGDFGSGTGNAYPPASTVASGVVLVTANYRLGFLGYLAHPGLEYTNFGLRDQVKALEWVRDNIRNFGGDPGRVTIVGRDAGASSALALMASPLSEGLFHGVIAQSPKFDDSLNVTKDQAAPLGQAIGQALEIPEGPEQLERMRALPFEALAGQEAIDTFERKGLLELRIYVDGDSMPQSALEAFKTNGYRKKIPVIVGSNANEVPPARLKGAKSGKPPQRESNTTLPLVDPSYCPETKEALERAVRETFEEDAYTVLSIFDTKTDAEAARSGAQAKTDTIFGYAPFVVAKTIAESGGKAYLYMFRQKPSGEAGKILGAFAGSETPYVFNSTDSHYNEDFINPIVDQGTANDVSSYWRQFIKTGDPNNATLGLETWLGMKSCPTCRYSTRKSAKAKWICLGGESVCEPVPWFKAEMYRLADRINTKMVNGEGTWFGDLKYTSK